ARCRAARRGIRLPLAHRISLRSGARDRALHPAGRRGAAADSRDCPPTVPRTPRRRESSLGSSRTPRDHRRSEDMRACRQHTVRRRKLRYRPSVAALPTRRRRKKRATDPLVASELDLLGLAWLSAVRAPRRRALFAFACLLFTIAMFVARIGTLAARIAAVT